MERSGDEGTQITCVAGLDLGKAELARQQAAPPHPGICMRPGWCGCYSRRSTDSAGKTFFKSKTTPEELESKARTASADRLEYCS